MLRASIRPPQRTQQQPDGASSSTRSTSRWRAASPPKTPTRFTLCTAHHGKGDAPDTQQWPSISQLVAAAAAAAVSCTALQGGAALPPQQEPVVMVQLQQPASTTTTTTSSSSHMYEQQVQQLHPRHDAAQRHPTSSLPTWGEAAALQQLHHDMFSDEAWAGMQRLQQYAAYVEELTADGGVEDGPACQDCQANRVLLERAFQTILNEYYSPTNAFSSAEWASRLLAVLKGHGGALHTRQEAYDALTQLVASLGDPYTAFLEPSAYRRALRRPLPAERKYYAAQFVGVGIQFGGLVPTGTAGGPGRLVEGPLAGSPAEAAGIRHGDAVLEIDGLPAGQLTLDETTTLLRGPSGSSVRLRVLPGGRGPGAAPRVLELERRPLPQPAIRDAQLPLPDGDRFVQYIRLNYFCHEATSGLLRVVSGAEADGRVAGYVIDMRNDPGGVFEEAVAMSALFEDPAVAVATTVRSGSDLVDAVWAPTQLPPGTWPDLAAGPLTSKPLVLLVNSNTASASEVLAGALHDHGRALLMGERTFGKGVVQSYFPLGDGSGLKVTVAKYLTPSHYDISVRGGLTPDVACRDFPHGVLTPGTADACTVAAMNYIMAAQPPDPLSFSPLLADVGGGAGSGGSSTSAPARPAGSGQP